MTATLRVLIVGPLPPPAGGMANQTRQLRRLLEAEGLMVPIVRTNEPCQPTWIERLRGLRALVRLLPYLRRLWVATGQADVVHVMANSGLAWFLLAAPAVRIAKWRHVPIVVNYRGGLAREFLSRFSRRVKATLQGTQLIVPSRFLLEVFASHGLAAAIIPNIVDVDLFRPAPDPKPERGRPHVVIARNLEKIYGIDVGLRALAMLRSEFPQLRASIAGSGPELGALEALTRHLQLDDCVRFTGRRELEEMVALYQDADVVLNPVRADNTPNSVLEALACGVPVVSTNVGGVSYLVEHGQTAWLVEPDSPQAIASGVAQVLGDGALRGQLVANGLELARSCAWTAVKARWLAAYARAQE